MCDCASPARQTVSDMIAVPRFQPLEACGANGVPARESAVLVEPRKPDGQRQAWNRSRLCWVSGLERMGRFQLG